jgi:hypothetical protein
MSEYISTHLIDAEARLLEQYKGQPNLKAFLDALVTPIQTLEDAFNNLNLSRALLTAEGVQLDRLGDIVGIKRLGLSDAVFRSRIKIRVIQNLSQGEPDRLIQVYESLLNASLVVYQEHYPAGAALMGNAEIPSGQETLIYQNVQNIAPVGVRVDYIETFPSVAPFAFAGGLTQSGGFGDLNDPTVGGGFGQIHVPVGIQFKFAGSDPDNQGFGDLRDPVMGGHFIGL